MNISSSAIVLNSLKYGDNSLITKLYSEESGLISVISTISKTKGKNKFQNYLLPLSVVKIECVSNKKQSIKRLKEIGFKNGFIYNNNVLKSTIRFFLSELISKLVYEEEANNDLYHFLEQQCLKLQLTDDLGSFIISFLCSFTIPLGIEPNIENRLKHFDLLNACFVNYPENNSYLHEEEAEIFYKAFNQKDGLNRNERRKAIGLILDYYRHQFSIELKLNSLEILDEVFS